ncbi:MAG TPA: 6-phosphogluconolactonase [Candidatus Sulfotelmatobacter sp.]|jgi:6-phosphogluconolactonase|nr:6-phosphogluconolactonase [Candidatus Sulfotelmatobacter sp.]
MTYWSAMADTGGTHKGVSTEIVPGVQVFSDPAEVARGAARLFVDYAWQSIAKDGQFMVALSGGNTPRQMFQLLASDEFRGQVDWAKVHFFWSDERAVEPTDAESNYGMARRELLIRVPIPEGNVHRMEAEKAGIGRAAHEYEEVLRKYLELDDRGFPRFHLIFLGLGTDGHTASLFPSGRVTRQTSRWVSTPMVTKLNMRRMTLTLPVLDAALRVVFLVVGAEKAQILREVWEGKADPPYPAQLVQPRHHGIKLFLVDKAAAALLTPDGSAKSSSHQSKPAGAARGGSGRRT